MKKLAAMVCAVALAMAMPVLAWAAPSPSAPQQNVAVAEGVTATITFAGEAEVVATSKQASNVVLGANDKVMGSIEITSDQVSEDNPLTLTFNVGSQYAGYTGKVFIQHNDGTTEVRDVTVSADGTVSLTVTKLSVFTLVVDTASGAATSDSSAASPKTGVDSSALAGGIAVLAVAAVGTGVALRKKIAE